MDRIFLRDLRIDAIIGIEPHERTERQPVVLELELGVDVPRAAAADRIEDALNYDELSRDVRAFVEASEFGLIETLAERITARVIERYGVPWMKLRLSKPQALPGSTVVGVEIERP